MGSVSRLLDTHVFLWWLFDDPRLPLVTGDRVLSSFGIPVVWPG